MIPIGSAIPTDAVQLRDALNAALRTQGAQGGAVTASGELPALERLDVRLDGARLAWPARAAGATGAAEGGFFARDVSFRAKGASVAGVGFRAECSARDVVFEFVRDGAGGVLMRAVRVAGGVLDFEITRAEIERAVLAFAGEAAARQGAEVKSAAVEIAADGGRGIALRAVVTAKAMMFTAGVTLSGKATVTDALALCFSDLECSGDGMIGSLAAGYIRPRLAEAAARPLSLARWLPSVVCEALEIHGGESLRVRGNFTMTAARA